MGEEARGRAEARGRLRRSSKRGKEGGLDCEEKACLYFRQDFITTCEEEEEEENGGRG